MSDVFKTITCLAANRQACRDAISNAKDAQGNPQPWESQGPTCFLGKRTTLQGGTVPTHYLMSGDIPQGMSDLFDVGGAGASLIVDFSDQAWMDVCARLGLYPIIED